MIALGPLMLNAELILFIVCSIIGYLALKYRLRRARVEESTSDKYVTALILGFMIWKFSLIVFDPLSVIRQPMSLIYFDGGDKGLWLAIAISILFLWMRARKDGTSLWMNLDLLSTGLLASSATYYLLHVIFDRSDILYHSVFMCISVGILIWMNFTKKAIGNRMVMKQLTIFVVIVFLCIGVVDAVSNHMGYQDRQKLMAEMNVGIKVGNKAPQFELLNLDDQPVILPDLVGKKVILNFWATWCPPCRVEMPQLQKFHDDYEQDVIVLAINLTNTEKNQNVVRAFIEDSEHTFPVALDVEGDVSNTYKVIAYPTSYFIDSQGIIQEVFEGAINYETMKKAISKLN